MTIAKTRDPIRLTFGGRTVDGVVALASPNGRSLVVNFDAVLTTPHGSGYAGSMPLLHDGETYRDLITGTPATVEVRDAAGAYVAATIDGEVS